VRDADGSADCADGGRDERERRADGDAGSGDAMSSGDAPFSPCGDDAD
jgi:hypothetical protein